MNIGEVIIAAVIRAAAIERAEHPTPDSTIFVWASNAEEQIEAALNEAGYTLCPNGGTQRPGIGTWHCVWKATFGHNSMLVSAPGRNPGNVVERMPELVASARAAHGPAASVRWDGLEFLGAICVPSV